MPDVIESADDLRARIHEYALTEPNPGVVTSQLLGELTTPEYRVVAFASLHEFVRRVMAHPTASVGDAPARESSNGSRPHGGSSKVKGIRDWVARGLLKPVFLGAGVEEGEEEKYKYFKDCTADDCMTAAAIRRRKAEQTVAEAERFEASAQAIKDNGVDHVGELDRSVLELLIPR